MLELLNLETRLETKDNLLANGIWEKADFHDLETESNYWNRATIVCLSKAYAKTSIEALLYLLQKESMALSIWQKRWANETPVLKQFIQSILSGKRFSNTTGHEYPVEEFWISFNEIIEGMRQDNGFGYTKNEVPGLYSNLLCREDIKQVYCFDDSWDEQNYFIETFNDWILFHWATVT